MIEDEEKEHEFNDLISENLKIDVFSYNDEVSDELFGVMKLISEKQAIFNTEIAKKLNLKNSHVELIQYILCNNDHAEYGGSPRGCWLTPKGEELYKKLANLYPDFKLENYDKT